MRYKAIAVAVALNVSLAATGISFAADLEKDNAPIGRVTAAFGIARIEGADGKRAGDLHAMLKNQERIVTDGGGVSILLASRVVLKVDAKTSLSVSESLGQTNVTLDYGSVHVFVGRRPASSGRVFVQDPQVRTETESGVYLVSYDPDKKSGFYACERNSLKLETIDGDRHQVTLAADTQAVLNGGKLNVNTIDRLAFDGRMKSLQRLGESTIEQGSKTFRLRSRSADMDTAITQLSAAGWIDRAALPQPTQSAAGSQTDSTGNTTETEKPQAASSANTPAITVKSEKAAASEHASPGETTLVVNPNNGAAKDAPRETPAALVISVDPPTSLPPASAPPVTAPPVNAPPKTETAANAPPAPPPSAPPVAIDIAPPAAVDLPQIDFGKDKPGRDRDRGWNRDWDRNRDRGGEIGGGKDTKPAKAELPSVPPVIAPPPITINPPTIDPPKPVEAPVQVGLPAGMADAPITKVESPAPIILTPPPVTAPPPVKFEVPVKVEAPPPVKIDVPVKVDAPPPIVLTPPPVIAPPPVKIDVPVKVDAPPPVKIDVPVKVDAPPPIVLTPPPVIVPPPVKIDVPIEPPPVKIDLPVKVDVPPPTGVVPVPSVLPTPEVPVSGLTPKDSVPTILTPPPEVPVLPAKDTVLPPPDVKAPAPAPAPAPIVETPVKK